MPADLDWDAIIKAYEYIVLSKIAKIEGPNWKWYWVGTSVLRLDIKEGQ